jgi:lysozyme family protein
MAASSYDEALARLLAHEGGYGNHPSDPGGPTNFGITIYDYRKYLKSNATAADVRAMKVADAKAIYRSKYWDAMRCDELAPGVDYCIFDYAVNSGTGRAPKVLQRLIRAPLTGRMDDATVRLARARDSGRLIADICDERLAFLQGLGTWRVFGNGWGRRVREVRAAALAMAARAGTASAQTAPPLPATGKGGAPGGPAAPAGAAGAVVAAGGAAALQSNEPVVIVLVIAATGATAIGAFVLWRWWRRRRQEAPTSVQSSN